VFAERAVRRWLDGNGRVWKDEATGAAMSLTDHRGLGWAAAG
jgi:hypothetical protein